MSQRKGQIARRKQWWTPRYHWHRKTEPSSRRNNLEISGIPNNISYEALETKRIEILEAVHISVDNSKIEACHMLPTNQRNKNKPKTVIVKFTNRKFVEAACSENNRERLKSCNKIELGFAENTELFFNENLYIFPTSILDV